MLKFHKAAGGALLCGLLLFVAFPAWVEAWDKVPDLTLLAHDQISARVTERASLLKDPGGDLTLDDVASPKMADCFKPVSSSSLGGALDSNLIYWLRFSLAIAEPAIPREAEPQSVLSNWVLDQWSASVRLVDLGTER